MNAQAQRTWLQRNTKWIVLGAVLLAAMLAACFIAVIFFIVAASMRSSDVYSTSLERAQTHPAVIAALGQPVEAGFMPTGSINVTDGNGHADLDIPISGPVGDATIEVEAHKRDGVWHYERMDVRIAEGKRVDLLQ